MVRIVVSGPPGVGKTTLVKKVANILVGKCGGFYTEEIRRNGKRIGFRAVDIATGRSCVLASIRGEGPRVGKYHVNLDAAHVIHHAVEVGLKLPWIIIDEVGPMEMRLPYFKKDIERAIKKDSFVITVHRSLARSFKKKGVIFFWLDWTNRDDAVRDILRIIREEG